MARYEAVGEWTTWRDVLGVKIEIADARDKRDGHVYSEGCYRVSGPNIRTKRWYGERAWIDATVYANDAVLELRRNA